MLMMQITLMQIRVCKDFERGNLGKYHDLYVQSNTLLLADVFENFQNMCFEINELYPTRFLPAPAKYTFLGWWMIQFLVKQWKMWENHIYQTCNNWKKK